MERQDGFALPVTLTIMSISLILILSTSVSMLYDRANAANDRSATQAEEVAKAGFTKYKTAAFQTFRYYVEQADKYATPASRSAQCGNLLSIGLDLGRDGIGAGTSGNVGDENDFLNGQSRTGTVAVGNSTGTYTVQYIVSGSGVILKSVGQVNGAKAVVQAFLGGQNSSGFSNAIFAGASGQSGKNLNGSADIYGSLYVEGAPDKTVTINANGGFGVHNFYTKDQLSDITDLSQDKLASFLKLQALEQTDMCASVRARQGKIAFGGNATIGDKTAPTGFKGAMKGVYAGQPDASGAYAASDYVLSPTDQAGKYTSITAEAIGPFDLVPPPTLPKLDNTGIVNLNKLPANVKAAVGTNPTWRTTIQKDAELNGLVIKKSGSSVVAEPTNSNCAIASAIVSGELVFADTTLNCKDSAGRGFTYTKDPAKDTWLLDINGTLDIKGLNVQFNENVIVRYEGKASMLVEKDASGTGGNVRINGDVLPYDSFPDKSVLGLIAENDLTISGANQNKLDSSYTKTQVVTGLFYAGNMVSAVKDSVVMGTLMGEGFDLSNGENGGAAKTQILQVPGLEYNLPPGFASLNNTSVPSFAVYSYERK